MLKTTVEQFTVTTCYVQGKNIKEVKAKRDELHEEGFGYPSIQVGYLTGEEESRVYWFEAIKKVPTEQA